MPGKYLDSAKRSRLCTLIEEGYTSCYIADDIGCSIRTVQGFRAKKKILAKGEVPEQKKNPGRPWKTTPRTDALIQRVVDEGTSYHGCSA